MDGNRISRFGGIRLVIGAMLIGCALVLPALRYPALAAPARSNETRSAAGSAATPKTPLLGDNAEIRTDDALAYSATISGTPALSNTLFLPLVMKADPYANWAFLGAPAGAA